MSVSLAQLKNSTLTFTNMDDSTVSLDPSTVNTYKNSVKKDYNNIISDWESIKKHTDTALNDKGTKGKFKTSLSSLSKNAKARKTYSEKKRDTLVKRVEADVAAYSDAILGKKITELEAKLAELEAKLSSEQ